MAKLKNNKKEEVAQEVVNESAMTPEEVESAVKQEEKKEKEGANTERLRLTTNVISGQFNLDNTYRVSKFDDKGKVVNLTLENAEFILSVTIKDSDRHGLHVED